VIVLIEVLNIIGKLIAYKYSDGKLKRTLKKEWNRPWNCNKIKTDIVRDKSGFREINETFLIFLEKFFD